MKMKFGNAKINNEGYYQITSHKEGNHGKLLHRLVWEDWYKKSVPEGCVIHHLNGDKLDNRIQNLQCVTKEAHSRFHNKGKTLSDETRKKLSEANKGRTLSDETRKKMSEANKGRTLSDETRKKLSEANKGENNPLWKDNARVIKKGITSNGKQMYALRYNGKNIKSSRTKEKLEELAREINSNIYI